MITIVVSIPNDELIHINSITNANKRITVTSDRCEPDCDSDGDVCIQLSCSSNGNLEYLLITKFSTTKVNGSAVSGGITDEGCEVVNITWGYEDTL